uniref:Helicase ATP-binding domain-containing protein n=1 Tax=Eptatretus burgeri TaxID=7764 RepID=A0A8C4QP73_EPTBU
MDDFAKDSKRFRVNLMKRKHRVQMGVTYDDELECNMCCCNGLTRERGSEEGHLQELDGIGGGCCPGGGPEDECKDEEKSHPVPKIFFATRTHKQISQVTRELARTAYGSVPMTILSSREFTCIHPEVSIVPHKAEACRELIEQEQEQHLHFQGKSCLFHQGVKRLSDQADLQGCWGLSRAWDIEDLVTLGRRTKACPYFAARALAAQASLIFCPYNYLIDPQIRQNIDIHLRGQIVVLDEAHNIEDSSREAASFSLSLPSICSASMELQSFAKTSETRASAYDALYALCFSIYGWMEEGENGLAQRDFELWCREWSGKEMVAILQGWGITPLTYKVLQRNFNLILEREEAQNIHAAKGNSKKNLSKRQVFLPAISAVTKGVLQGLLMVLGYLFKEEYRYAEDYRVVLARSMASSAPKPDQPDAEGFFSRQPVGKRNKSRIMAPLLTLHLWCLNPAVAFSEIAESAHCVVLSSGTLAPLTSFASELNTPFPIQLEASHVIPENQLWVGSLGQGPSGRPLCATYKNVDTFPFQDELGDLLLAVSQIIPNGLLCFVPSYRVETSIINHLYNHHFQQIILSSFPSFPDLYSQFSLSLFTYLLQAGLLTSPAHFSPA